MFFKQTVLKRMFKAAYKGAGLTVGHMAENETDPEGYYISSGWWVMWFSAAEMPKEAKAAIIELSGDLPGVGEVFRAIKDMGNQYEIEQKEIFNLPAAFKKCECHFRVTKLLGQQGDKVIRFIQEDGTTRHVAAVSEIFIDLIDPKAIDYDGGEYEPIGPVTTCPTAPFMYWGNNTCYLMAGIRTPVEDDEEEANFWKYLEGIEIL
ncbi:MAG: hypothetical protein HDQ97_09035 [Lachnospiraceae bacterium]|nr:hypothetical protein [Lachnospiraceae bacterium]